MAWRTASAADTATCSRRPSTALRAINAAYVAATLAYAWQRESTGRFVTVAGTDDLTAGFAANDIGGRIEGGYRFAIPDIFAVPGLGFIPYAAFQMQAFYTPAYSETAASGSSQFALAYDAQTTTVTRTELGAWFDDAHRARQRRDPTQSGQ